MNDRAVEGREGYSLPQAVAKDLDQFGVGAQVRALVAAASAQRSITSHVVEGDYVAVSPGAGGHIAWFVHEQRVTVALPSRRADLVGALHDWSVSRDRGVTSYVRIPATALASEAQRAAALPVLHESLDYRALGPSRNVAGAAQSVPAGRTVEMCPVHFTQLLGGRCEFQDD